MDMKDPVTQKVLAFVRTKDEVSAKEIGAHLQKLVLDELDRESWKDAHLSELLVLRGSTSYGRDVIKRPRVIEAMLDQEDPRQGYLYEGFDQMMALYTTKKGWFFKRRHLLSLNEYNEAVGHLRETAMRTFRKANRFEDDRDRALPFWREGMTFGDAFIAANDARAGAGPGPRSGSDHESRLLHHTQEKTT